jgi:AGZA family xanthine/uracil permease-like MFS transporter
VRRGVVETDTLTASLIYVGLLMLGGLKKIDFDDIYQSLPVAIMLISMPISGSIGHGIGLGLISYSVLKLCTGKGKEVSVLTYVISVIFLVKFFLIA